MRNVYDAACIGSMINRLYILWYAKRHSWVEATSSSEKISPVVLVVVELHLSEGIRQGRQLYLVGWFKKFMMLNIKILKFCGNI